MLVGYARCSTREQDPNSQVKESEKVRKERIRKYACKFLPHWVFVIRRQWIDWNVAVRRRWHVHLQFSRLIRPRTFNDKVPHRVLFDRRAVLTKLQIKRRSAIMLKRALAASSCRNAITSRSTPTPFPSISFLTDLWSSAPTVPVGFRSSPTNRAWTGPLS